MIDFKLQARFPNAVILQKFLQHVRDFDKKHVGDENVDFALIFRKASMNVGEAEALLRSIDPPMDGALIRINLDNEPWPMDEGGKQDGRSN